MKLSALTHSLTAKKGKECECIDENKTKQSYKKNPTTKQKSPSSWKKKKKTTKLSTVRLIPNESYSYRSVQWTERKSTYELKASKLRAHVLLINWKWHEEPKTLAKAAAGEAAACILPGPSYVLTFESQYYELSAVTTILLICNV